jgi:hypothetical protein
METILFSQNVCCGYKVPGLIDTSRLLLKEGLPVRVAKAMMIAFSFLRNGWWVAVILINVFAFQRNGWCFFKATLIITDDKLQLRQKHNTFLRNVKKNLQFYATHKMFCWNKGAKMPDESNIIFSKCMLRL